MKLCCKSAQPCPTIPAKLFKIADYDWAYAIFFFKIIKSLYPTFKRDPVESMKRLDCVVNFLSNFWKYITVKITHIYYMALEY